MHAAYALRAENWQQ